MNWKDRVYETLATKKPEVAILDGCGGDKGGSKKSAVLDSAAENAVNSISLEAISSVQQWLETDDLEDGETSADRLLSMVIGIADANKDGEITDDEQGVIDIALEAIWDYLEKYGVDDADISALLEDWSPEAAERIRDLLAASIPEGSAAEEEIDDFVFGGEDNEPMLDAAYKKVVAIRRGKKVRINKRISGTVKLTAKQKLAIRKAGMKAHSAVARMRRAKSVMISRKAGIYK